MTTTNDGRSFVWAVFDADGCECKNLSAIFSSEERATDFASRLNASAKAEQDEMYSDEDWEPTIRRIISVEMIELDVEPDITSTLKLLQEIRRNKSTARPAG